jgi:hypothetical protein
MFFVHNPSDPTFTARWRTASTGVIPTNGTRTLGVWLGGDKSNINNWAIPRTDSTNVPNSTISGPVIQSMDWTQPINVRVFMTDDWGVTILRPDMPLPPYYTPRGTPGGGFTNVTVEPSAGWINVEYPKLPRLTTGFGTIAYGAMEPGISVQSWSNLSYTVSKPPAPEWSPFPISTQGQPRMVLNQYNVVTSGEKGNDYLLNSVDVAVTNSRQVSLIPAHMYASSVYKIIDGQTIWDRSKWYFDPQTQMVTLKIGAFQSSTVTVMFVPGTPTTTTYLLNQPLLDSVTLLNEGTPPFPKSRMAPAAPAVQAAESVPHMQQLLAPPGANAQIFYGQGGDPTAGYSTLGTITVTITSGGNVGVGHATVSYTPPSGSIASSVLNPIPATFTLPEGAGVLRFFSGSGPFRLNDVYQTGVQTLTFIDDPSTLYEGMEFMDVTNGGWQRLISTIGEGIQTTNPGWVSGEGEPIYSTTGGGASYPGGVGINANLHRTGTFVGDSQGAGVIGLSGALLNETPGTPRHDAVQMWLDGSSVLLSPGYYNGPMGGEFDRLPIMNDPYSGLIGP